MTDAPAFEAPWHAQVFALTVHLNEAGAFEWPAWAARFGAELAERGLSKELNGGSDYFEAWLAALEAFLSELELAKTGDLHALRSAWETAYLNTPHGQPVRLDETAG